MNAKIENIFWNKEMKHVGRPKILTEQKRGEPLAVLFWLSQFFCLTLRPDY